ncbi:MAG: lipase [Armatimonadetes bacterium 13_1_40CM_64_14]|nr:MAG: lipase [Armatimonadetes bacterium 13_1_40CM_64_14]
MAVSSRLDPQAKTFLDQRTALGVRPVNELTVEAAREQAVRVARAMSGPAEPVARVDERLLPGPYGDIPVRIYLPARAESVPMLVYFHGGGWVVGNLETVDAFCRSMTNLARCTVVSVNYRHAPEHKFPLPVEDAYAATQWVATHAGTLGGNPARLAVGGTSAGGAQAAVVAQIARDRRGPQVACQLLIVPVTDHNFETTSYRENADGYGLTADAMRWYWSHYLHTAADGAQPYASPIRAASLRGLPPAVVVTAEFDPLRDEGEAYAARLRADGVPVVSKRYNGMVHQFLGSDSNAEIARMLRQALAD